MSSDTIVAKATRMYELLERINVIKKKLSEYQKEYDAIRNDELPDEMETREIPRITVGAIGRSVSLFPMLRTTMKEKEAGMDWLRENDFGEIITEIVPWQSLDALVREQIKEGQEFPEDIFEIRAWQQARLRKG